MNLSLRKVKQTYCNTNKKMTFRCHIKSTKCSIFHKLNFMLRLDPNITLDWLTSIILQHFIMSNDFWVIPIEMVFTSHFRMFFIMSFHLLMQIIHSPYVLFVLHLNWFQCLPVYHVAQNEPEYSQWWESCIHWLTGTFPRPLMMPSWMTSAAEKTEKDWLYICFKKLKKKQNKASKMRSFWFFSQEKQKKCYF